MLKAVGAAIAGYVVAVVLVFAGLSLLWVLLGPAGAFEPAVWETSLTWNLTNPLVGLAASVAGGYVCAFISRGRRAIGILIGFIVVLGILSTLAATVEPAAAEPRPEVVTLFEAMSNAHAPLWAMVLNPIVGVIGVLIGSRLRGRPAASRSS
ncbi:MAG: hypothetical protein HKO59_03505 [Phycisphaerales bacterium]|nr:hypothetical protein [Phycisphaerae bacterium]NNM25048.1 hypothetical protein [Phycisphaerales bacterium]